MTNSFGPSALATPANAVSIVRILVAPICFALITADRTAQGSWPAVIVWVGLCCTDGIDGFLARRHGATRSGAFLDPLADKVLVLGALFALVANAQFWFLPVGLIALREIVISVYRSHAGRRGITIPARPLAKLKTVVQQVAVAFAIVPLTAHDHRWISLYLLWGAVALTLFSGAQYLLDARRVAGEQLALVPPRQAA